jgi:hypothetical protein
VGVEGQSPVCSGGGGDGEEQGTARTVPGTDGYGSDDEDPDPDDGRAASDGSSNSSGRGRGSVRSEEWVGWMGNLRCQPRVAANEHIRVSVVIVYHCTMNICFTLLLRDLGMCRS